MRVLFTDDDVSIRGLFSVLLINHQIEGDVFCNVSEARDAALAQDYDWFVLDYQLGDGFGLELVRDGTVDSRKVLLLSAYDKDQICLTNWLLPEDELGGIYPKTKIMAVFEFLQKQQAAEGDRNLEKNS